MFQIFQKRNAVCVSLGKHLIRSFPVVVDNRNVVRTAMDYLISLGHHRIAYISGPTLLTTTAERLAGYKESLEAHGIELDETLILSGNYKYDSGWQAAAVIDAMAVKPTAVLASNDIMAISLIAALKEMNYRIPEDISVMGIDDIPFAKFVDPALTTVSLPLYEMGQVAMESLIKLHKGEMLEENGIKLPHKLIVRKSTAQVGDSKA